MVLTYKVVGECNACPAKGFATVKYHWQDNRVVMEGTPPEQ